MTVYYVYQYLRDDNTPYYIGKGKGNRAWTKHPRKNGSNILPNDKSKIEIVKDNLNEDEAIALEISLIDKYGRKDLGTGVLLNMTNGGEGLSGAIRTQTAIDAQREKLKGKKRPKELMERIAAASRGKKRSTDTKEKLRNIHLGKKQSPEQIEKRISKIRGIKRSDELKLKLSETKMGDKNPMFGKKHTPESNAKRSAAQKGKPKSHAGKPWSDKRRASYEASKLLNKYDIL